MLKSGDRVLINCTMHAGMMPCERIWYINGVDGQYSGCGQVHFMWCNDYSGPGRLNMRKMKESDGNETGAVEALILDCFPAVNNYRVSVQNDSGHFMLNEKQIIGVLCPMWIPHSRTFKPENYNV